MNDDFLEQYEIRDYILTLPSGDVHRGFDRKNKKDVLVKVINAEKIKRWSSGINIAERFSRYVKNLSRLSHPNILTPEGYNIENNDPIYSIYNYFDIKNSFFTKDTIGNYSIEEKFKIALSLVDALAYLHKQRIVHQNLYLDSIFLISGDIKIDHIGLRRSLTRNEMISEFGYFSNIPPNIPPEYLNGAEPNETGDVFQIGSFLYFIFTGEHPFGSSINDESMSKLKSSNFGEFLNFKNAPTEISRVIEKCLSKEPKDRYGTAIELLQDLKQTNQPPSTVENEVNVYRFFIENDKMFIQTNPRVTININELEEKLLNENIYNYNIDKIAKAIQNSNGTPIEIGEVFKKIDESVFSAFEISVTDDHMKCYLKKINNEFFNENEVLFFLRKKGVRFGFINEAIREIAKSRAGSVKLVAKGALPTTGEDAYTIFFFEREDILKPRENEEGKIDFKNLSVIQQVNKGDTLVLKIPFTKGIDGFDVFGQIIKATPGRDIKLPTGKNTVLSNDGLKLLADKDGVISFSDSNVDVLDIITIDGNVDFSTGNISHKGDVFIKGDVLPDFKVIAGGDIKIGGVVEGAYIESEKGSVIIHSGVFGKGQTRIKAYKDIKASFVQDAELIAGETIEILDYTRNSKVSCRDFLSHKGNGLVQGSTIEAKRTIDINAAGAKNFSKTSLIITPPSQAELSKNIEGLSEKLKEFSKAIAETKQQIKKVLLSYDSIEKATKSEEYKKTAIQLKKLEEMEKLLQSKLESYQKELEYAKSGGNLSIIIRKNLFRDVKINIASSIVVTTEEYHGRIVITKNEENELLFLRT